MTKLYISYYGDSISIVEGSYKKNKFIIDDVILMNADDIEPNYNDKYNLLKEALASRQFKSKKAVLCLNTRDVIIKSNKIPKIGPKELDGIMSMEIDEMISLERDQYTFSYEVVREFEEDGEIITKLDDDGNQIQKTMVMKINVPKGTIITKDMMYESGKGLKDSERIQEFNMIRLPSQLKNGDFIDVRFSLPNGQDFVVLSKKKVIGTNATTVWLQLDELELNLMNNAIVESYKATGSRLYAIEYIEPGMQKDAVPTYVASSDVLNLINRNPNIISKAREKYGENINGLSDFRALNIESSLEATRDQSESLVSSGNANEDQSIKAERQTYVDALEGTDDIGYIE